MRKLIFISLSILLLIGCNSSSEKNQEIINRNIGLKEKFIIKGFNVGVEIYLKPNFTFINNCYSYGCIGGFRVKVTTGQYEIDNNQIYFKPEKMVWKEDWTNHYWESKLKFDTVAYYESDSTSIQKKYWLIQKGKMRFLVSESEYNEQDELFYRSSNFISLANLYNSNTEQNANENLLSNTDTLWNFRELQISQNIPNIYRDFFLDTEIKTEIISSKVYKIGESLIPRYKLHIDEDKKVKIGMKFYSQKFPNYPIVIIEKNGKNFIAEGYDLFYENTKLEKGTKVSTERKTVANKKI
jgi:hypothetical protein